MIQLRYKQWKDISISAFYSIQNILEDTELSDLDRNIALLEIFSGIDKDELVNYPLSDCEAAIVDIKMLFDTELPKDAAKLTDSISIKDGKGNVQKYKVVKKPEEISVGQYIDFQNYTNTMKNNIAEVLSVFLIPKGKKYGEEYDVTELIDTLNNNLDIITARQLYNFFLSRLKKSTTRSLTYFRYALMMNMWKMKMNSKIRKGVNQSLKNMTQVVGTIF